MWIAVREIKIGFAGGWEPKRLFGGEICGGVKWTM